MKKICICYFSGTGMTKYIVDKLSTEFEKYQISADCLQVEALQKGTADLSNYDLLGIAYPVHVFNAPKIIIDFANHLPKSNGLNTFIIRSMGEDNPVNYASSSTLIKKLKDKGYHVFYNKIFVMPCNFIIKYEPPKVDFIIDTVNRELPTTAREIINLTVHLKSWNCVAKFMNIIGKTEWLGAHVMGKFFYINRSCTQCGKCVDNCPNHNVVKSKKVVRFKWNCSLCMRCIYQCPTKAIKVHQPFKFIFFDDWYDFNGSH